MNVLVSPDNLATESDAAWDRLHPYMQQACRPIRRWLQDPTVIEIMVNRPGEVWVEAVGRPGLEMFRVPELTNEAIVRLAERVAAHTEQSVNEATPLLSAAMPNGERFQGVLAPAAAGGGGFSIRKQVISQLTLEEYHRRGAFDHVKVRGAKIVDDDDLSDVDRELARMLIDTTPAGMIAALRYAVRESVTMFISGGTSSGKTTFLNALLREVPHSERVVSIEDTRELKPPQPNYLALMASKGDQGKAKVSVQSLLEAALRLRPDRIFLGEIRGAEAYTFLQAVNTGHPGSLTTLHADSPYGAYERIALATMQAGLGLTKSEILDYVKSVVPLVVQLRRKPTRGVSEIYFNKLKRP
jgi:type IV secretion system protein VirB11